MTGVYIFLFDYKPKQKKEKGRKKGKEKKEKGKRKKGKEKEGRDVFLLTQDNKPNLFGEKKHIFSPGGKNIIYFWDVNVFIIGPKCNTSGEKYKFELKNLIKNSNRNAWKAL